MTSKAEGEAEVTEKAKKSPAPEKTKYTFPSLGKVVEADSPEEANKLVGL